MEEYQLMCLKSVQMSITWTNNIFSSSAIVVAACGKIHGTKKRRSTTNRICILYIQVRERAHASRLLTDNNATISKCKSHLGPFNLKTNQLINHSKWKRFIIYLFVWYLFFHIKQCTLLSRTFPVDLLHSM